MNIFLKCFIYYKPITSRKNKQIIRLVTPLTTENPTMKSPDMFKHDKSNFAIDNNINGSDKYE